MSAVLGQARGTNYSKIPQHETSGDCTAARNVVDEWIVPAGDCGSSSSSSSSESFGLGSLPYQNREKQSDFRSEQRRQELPSHRRHDRYRYRRRRRRLIDILTTAIFTLTLTTIFQHAYHALTFSPDALFHSAIASTYSDQARLAPQYTCGTNAAEAIDHDCVFDISVVGWVPRPCFDAELHRRFLDFGWRFFLDRNGTDEVDETYMAAVAGTGAQVWVQHGYHVTHCGLAWERMHKAVMTGGRTTTHLMNLHHTRHCGRIVEMRDDYYSLNARIIPSLNTC